MMIASDDAVIASDDINISSRADDAVIASDDMSDSTRLHQMITHDISVHTWRRRDIEQSQPTRHVS